MSDLGNKEIMARNIQRYMNKMNVDRTTLCYDLGIKYTTLTDWLKAKTYPRIDKIEMLANYFDISKADLVEDSMSDSDGVLIPVYGHVAAGEPIDANQDIVGYEKIDPDLARRGDFYALVIKGDSMYPDIQDGDTIIVRAQPDAENKQIVVATVNGDDATCKKLYKLPGGGIQLHSINPTYEPFTFSEGDISSIPVRILGVVMEMRRRYA